MCEIVCPEVLRQSFASFAKKKPTVPYTELTPTAVKSIGIEAQAQKNRDNNILVTGLITEHDCIAVLRIQNRLVSHSRILPSESRGLPKTTST